MASGSRFCQHRLRMPRFDSPFERIFIAALVLCLGARAAVAEEESAKPTEKLNLPLHPSGGIPPTFKAEDKKPGRTPEQQAALENVAGELRRIASAHGPDSVVLQSKLLVRSMSAGAVGPTEVRVAGPSTGEAGPGHLEIDVETGLIFDEKTTTAESRRETVWKDVALPVLDEMVSFKIEPASLELVFLFDVQRIYSGETPTLAPDARHEAFRVLLARDVLEELVSNELVGDAMREKAVLTPAVAVARPVAAIAD